MITSRVSSPPTVYIKGVKLEFLEFRGQTFRQKLSKNAVLMGKSRVVFGNRKSTMIVERALACRNREVVMKVKPETFSTPRIVAQR